ncbi:MAG: bifunctional metallophosphatase/5'-nucleotidase [Bacteroidetes bacterium]|nr:bifunctional metallophosphatase/5'-nucleotidase [Bacteroidota bacterium]
MYCFRLCFVLLWCFTRSTTLFAQQPDFILIQMNDVYEIAPMENGARGGLARVATLRKQLMQESPKVITVISGDFLSPSLFNVLTWQGVPIKGRQMVETFNALGMDYAIMGNHEYDHGPEMLKQRIQDSRFQWLSTNVQEATPEGPRPFMQNGKPLPTHITLPVSAGKGKGQLILVGLTLDYRREWLAVSPPIEAMHAWLQAHPISTGKKPKTPTALVALTHDYRSRDSLLAVSCTAPLLIAGGHDHHHMHFTVGKTAIAKADANAKTVYVHRFYYQASQRQYLCKSELVAIDHHLAEDPAVKAVADTWMARALTGVREMGLDPGEVLFNAATPLYGSEQAVRSQPTNLAQHICKAMLMAAPEAHLAILGGGSIRLDDDHTGPYTAYDVARTLPFGGQLVELEINGKTLLKILGAGQANSGTGGYLQYGSPSSAAGGASPVGMDAEEGWRLDGKRVDKAGIYRIVVNDYLVSGKEHNLEFLHATSSEILQTFPHYSEEDPRADIRKAFILYLRSLQ